VLSISEWLRALSVHWLCSYFTFILIKLCCSLACVLCAEPGRCDCTQLQQPCLRAGLGLPVICRTCSYTGCCRADVLVYWLPIVCWPIIDHVRLRLILNESSDGLNSANSKYNWYEQCVVVLSFIMAHFSYGICERARVTRSATVPMGNANIWTLNLKFLGKQLLHRSFATALKVSLTCRLQPGAYRRGMMAVRTPLSWDLVWFCHCT